jgi:hypothetical protein
MRLGKSYPSRLKTKLAWLLRRVQLATNFYPVHIQHDRYRISEENKGLIFTNRSRIFIRRTIFLRVALGSALLDMVLVFLRTPLEPGDRAVIDGKLINLN